MNTYNFEEEIHDCNNNFIYRLGWPKIHTFFIERSGQINMLQKSAPTYIGNL